MLIGSSVFWDLLCIGRIQLGTNLPILQKTKFGWIVTGSFQSQTIETSHCNLSQNIETDISKFWEIEECKLPRPLSADENYCENHFVNTFQRNECGRFVVNIPLCKPSSVLGDSKQGASKRFYSLERKLNLNPHLKSMYFDFIKDYINLGHMHKLSPDNSNLYYYLPHHGVYKDTSTTTKLRVVFDGSYKTTSGISLNDIQLVGPMVQNDLTSILLRFRQHTYVVSADIEKMYRQVLVCPEQRTLQCILWRFDSSQTLDTYVLNTVTYGTASASFLSTRCLIQLAKQFSSKFPEASKIIESDMYVDDLLTGSDSRSNLILHCSQVNEILNSGCFPLRKWISNDPSIIHSLNTSSNEPNLVRLGEPAKTLGLYWCPEGDLLKYKITVNDLPITKRSILSTVSQIYDPLGLLSPCVIKIKILLQKLWYEGINWDESIPMNLHSEWTNIRNQLLALEDISINRCIKIQKPIQLELHGFSDASERGYGACIYLRSLDHSNNVNVQLLCAKSKVAPMKTVSLPRLELCGALILSRLVKLVTNSLSLIIDGIYLWSDSTIVLGWINTAPNLLKTFVANRVSEIINNCDNISWFHVSSQHNPADLLTRGLNPSALKYSNLWWNGPDFLSTQYVNFPVQPIQLNISLPDTKVSTTSLTLTSVIPNFPFERFSSLLRLKRCIAFCLRFKHNSLPSNKDSRLYGSISLDEMKQSEIVILKMVQLQHFNIEIVNLNARKVLPTKSSILSLHPFMDEAGLLRVGGRLDNSSFKYEKRHPILLPHQHHVTRLIVEQEHINSLHAGPQNLLARIREKYWPIYGRSLVKKIVCK